MTDLFIGTHLIDTLKSLSGIKKNDDVNYISMSKYNKIPDPNRVFSSENKLAVIYAEGTIVIGKGNETNIGGNYYADIIRDSKKGLKYQGNSTQG